MIRIKEEQTGTAGHKPYYKLRYYYMIGDANGDTKEDVRVSVDNPYLERYVKLLNSLKSTQGYWGIKLEPSRLRKHLRENQITEDDYQFLMRMMFEEGTSTFEVPKENEKYADEFIEGVRSDAEYSFLVFQGCKLFYYDEFGQKHKTEINESVKHVKTFEQYSSKNK
jgi:hypothetical protein